MKLQRTTGLSALLGPVGARRFLSRAWPDDFFVVHRKPQQLPDFFGQGPLSSFDEISQVYAGRLQIAGGRGDSHLQFSVSHAPPTYLRRIGLTVFFGDDVSPYSAPAAEFLRELEQDLGAPAGIGAIRMFASPPEGGLEAHYDQGETFIVQLEGEKELRLAKNRTYPSLQFIPGKPPAEDHFPEFTAGFPARAPEDEIRVLLKPGSVLFIPRGMWHRTEAAGASASFSASICVDTPNAVDLLLGPLRALLRQSPEWREPLFGAWGEGREAATKRLTTLLAELGERLPRLSAEGLIDATGELNPGERSLRAESRFQRVPTTRLGFGTGRKANRLVVKGYGGAREVEIQVSQGLKPSCKWLEERMNAFHFGEFVEAHPRVDRAVLETLTRSLVTADALKWLDFETF